MAEAPKFELPAIVRERLQATATTTTHPEPDLLAAFSERTLPEAERETVLAHLSACDRCREVLALISPEEGPPRVAAQTVVERAGFNWRVLRWGAVAAAIAVVAVLTIPRLERSAPQTADLRRPSENAPAQAPAKEQAETKSLSAAGSITRDRVEASGSAPIEGRTLAASRLDHLSEKAKTAGSSNVEAFFDKKAAKGERERAVGDFGSAGAGLGSGLAGGVSGAPYSAKSAAAPAPSAPASEPSAAASYAANDKFEMNSLPRNASTESAANTANEMTLKKDEARVAAQKQGPARTAQSETADMAAPSSLAGAQLRTSELAVVAAPSPSASSWRVRTGRLEHLAANGAGWQRSEVESGAHFTAVFALEQDVWAGTQTLVVYHSSDGGASWTKSQLKPQLNNVRNGRITKINFSDPQHGQLFVRGEAADGSPAEDLWTSNDGGKSWLFETID